MRTRADWYLMPYGPQHAAHKTRERVLKSVGVLRKEKTVMKVRRILALVGVILLVLLYVSTLVFSLMSGELAHDLLRASIFCTVLIPVMIYGYTLIYRLLKKHGEDENKRSEP